MNSDQVKIDVIGRWPGIMASLGIEVGDGRHTSCPLCGGVDRFRFDDKEGRGTFYCNHCGSGDGWKMVCTKLGVDFPEAIKEVAGIVGTVDTTAILKEPGLTKDKMIEIFKGSKPVAAGDPVHQYLTKRGLSVIPSVLRYHPACWETETKKNQHAMLAVFHGVDGVGITMHRTYLTGQGEKLNIEKSKKILPSLRKMTGGAARLFPAGEILGIAEGIETAIAAHENMKIPVWAALSATLLESFEPPLGTKGVAIMADNDRNYAGQKAAYSLASRLELKGITANVYVPQQAGQDWLDVLNEGKHN